MAAVTLVLKSVSGGMRGPGQDCTAETPAKTEVRHALEPDEGRPFLASWRHT